MAYHHGNLREQLLDLAWDAVEFGGTDALTLRGLARQAGVSHGASARHFADRDALLDALALRGFERMNAAVAAAAAGSRAEGAGVAEGAIGGDGAECDVPARLIAVAQAYAGFCIAHPGILSVMYGVKHAAHASAELVAASHASMIVLVALIREGQASGSVVAGDADHLALAAFSAVHGVANLAAGDLLDGMPVDAAVETVVALVWTGLTPRGHGAGGGRSEYA